MLTEHSIYLFDAIIFRKQLIHEPAGFETKPPGAEQQRLLLSQERSRLKFIARPKSRGRLRLSIRGWKIIRLALLLSLFTIINNPGTASAQSRPNGLTPDESKSILVLCSYGCTLPAYQKIVPAFLAVMQRAGSSTNAASFEYLDLLRSRDPVLRQDLANMLRHKYARSGIALIVTFHAPAMTFLLNEAKDVFPNVPIMSWNVREAFKEVDGKSRIIRLSIGLDLQGTLERALDLFPQTRRVVFITGVSEIDKYVATEAKNAFADWKNRLQFEYTSNYSVEEMLKRIAKLPPHSIAIYGNIFQDKTGRNFTPRDVGQMFARTANAPVFGLYDTLMGRGMVGGSLLSFEAEGTRAGMLALDILNGKISRTGQTTPMIGKPVTMFDWQQIKKWGGQLDRLPPDSTIINRPAALWDRHAWHIIALSGFLLGQLLLVASLLIQRSHRGRAEKALKESNESLEQRVAERTAKLKESEARYRSLFSSMTEGFAHHEIILDTGGKPCDYRFLEINPAFERLTGLSRAAAVGKTVREVIPNIEAHWIETYGRVALDGIPVHIENYSAPLNRWYEVFGYRTAPGQFAVVFKDITGRKQAEEALAASERKYRELLETANSIIIRWDNQGVIRFINDYGLRFFDYSAEQLIGRNVTAIVPKVEESTGRDLEVLVKQIIIHPEEYTNVPNENIRRDGKTAWVAWTNKAILDEHGNVQEILAIGNDITALKETEKALRQLSHFPEENPNPVMRCTLEGLILYANTAAKTWLATLDRSTDGVLPTPVRAAVAETRGQDHTIETEITNSAGRTFGIFSVQPAGENYINLYGIDLTERKRAEQALRASEERIRASLGEKEVLLKEIHHRVKNNMQVISSLVALHADELQDDAMRAVLLDVTHRVRSMAMVHEKLYQSADLARVEFAEYVRSLLNYLWRAHGDAASEVRLSLDLEPVSLPVSAAVPCGLILNELISNALKHAFYGGSGGEVAVSLRGGASGLVCLWVRDNGMGLPAAFDWRQTRSLGLRLVQMLAGQIHAAVEVSNSGGTAFKITFEGSRV